MNSIVKISTTYVEGRSYSRFLAKGDRKFLISSTEGVLKYTFSPYGNEVVLTTVEGTEADLLLTMQTVAPFRGIGNDN